MIPFEQLGLSQPVLKVLSELGFEEPTEIQEKSIPQLISGQSDFIGLAQTGTGKTAAFGLPLIERIDPSNKSTQALIVAPTRELGQQIAEQLTIFGKHREKVNILPVYGGAAISNQIRALKKPQHIIIATPGRLIDLIQRKAVKLGDLKFVVLDEADEMLNMGFKEDIDHILSFAPKHIQTWLFSATMPKEIKKIVNTYMDQPYEVRIDPKNEVNTDIDHYYVMVSNKNKTEALMRFMDGDPTMRGVVFCRTRRETQALAESLLAKNYKADALHGDLSQAQRDNVMRRFKENDLQLLVATDVAARGIDVNDLTHVFHFTLPDDLSYYTHRSGRTARAGKKGISLAFIGGRDRGKVQRLEKQLGIHFTKTLVPRAEDVLDVRIENWCRDVLETRPKKLDSEILEKVDIMFGMLSKEELIAKMVKMEVDRMNLGETKDLNAAPGEGGGGKGGGRGRGKGKGKGRGRGKGGGKFKGHGPKGKHSHGKKKKKKFKKGKGQKN